MAHLTETWESHGGSVISIWVFGSHKFRVIFDSDRPDSVEPWAERMAASVWKTVLFMRQIQFQPIHNYVVYVHGASIFCAQHCKFAQIKGTVVQFAVSLSSSSQHKIILSV